MSIGSCDCCDAERVPVHNVVWNGMDVTTCYVCQGDIFDPYGEMVEVECSACGGDGRFEILTGYNPRNGEPDGYMQTCGVCNGTGGEFIPCEPMTVDDLEFIGVAA